MTEDHTTSLGAGELEALAARVLGDWQGGAGAEAEELETCECCGGLLQFEDPQQREMVEQWQAWQAEPREPVTIDPEEWDDRDEYL